jgi:hypothetical protein
MFTFLILLFFVFLQNGIANCAQVDDFDGIGSAFDECGISSFDPDQMVGNLI